MSFKSGLIGRIYLLHWVASPRRVDVFRLVEDLGSMRRKVGRPLIALGVVSRNACEPDLPARAEMIRNHRIWYESCESVNVVLQAQGFAATVVRTIMAQITLVARSGVIKVHPSVDIAIQRIARTLDRDPEELKRQIELTGVLSPA
ncbi:MAG TPA: hypothetical protein VNO21_19070 [Polyangiaceae bacterium]|nr:hypothetical protein [Polyangiaceae bacterium]